MNFSGASDGPRISALAAAEPARPHPPPPEANVRNPAARFSSRLPPLRPPRAEPAAEARCAPQSPAFANVSRPQITTSSSVAAEPTPIVERALPAAAGRLMKIRDDPISRPTAATDIRQATETSTCRDGCGCRADGQRAFQANPDQRARDKPGGMRAKNGQPDWLTITAQNIPRSCEGPPWARLDEVHQPDRHGTGAREHDSTSEATPERRTDRE